MGVVLTEQQKELILFEETEKRFGYRVEDLSPNSKRKIVNRCVICGKEKETLFSNFTRNSGLSHLQCKTEKAKRTNLERYGVVSTALVPEIRARQKHTLKKRYGVEHPIQAPQIRDRMKHTMQERHGVDFFTQSPEMQDKSKQTCLERYGVEHSGQSVVKQEKTKKTCLEKYGVESTASVPEFREKQKQTCLRRYGVPNAFLSPEVQTKRKQTCLEKFGTEQPLASNEIWEKTKQTMVKRYGVRSLTQLPEYRDYLKKWHAEHPDFDRYTSKHEIELRQWVQQYFPETKKYNDGTHEIDVYIPGVRLGIEYDGLYWHREDNVGKNYHLDKTKYFQEKGIRLIHIFEHEWMKRQKQVKSFLLSVMGKNECKVGARKCSLIWSFLPQDIKEVHQFLEEYHIQGKPNNNTKYVIRVLYNNELLAVATFGKHHRTGKKWVLTRFCIKTNYTLQGLLSKISKLASQQLKEDVISWADFRLSNGNGYEQAGWVLEKLLPPDYFYHKTGYKIISKQSRQKRIVKTPKGMTESEHAKQDGLHKVYDCGKIRYWFKYNG